MFLFLLPPLLLPRLLDAPEDLDDLLVLAVPVRGPAVEGLPVDNGLTELLPDREPLTLGRRLKKSLLPALLPVLRVVVLVGLPVIEDGRRPPEPPEPPEVDEPDEVAEVAEVVEVGGLPVVGPVELVELVDGRLKERPIARVPELCPEALRSRPTPAGV